MGNLCIGEYGCVEVNRLLGTSALLADKHERRSDLLCDFTAAHEHQLPRKAKPVYCPSISFAERILAEFHERRTAFGELTPQCIDFLFCGAGNEKRYSRCELVEAPRIA